MTDQVLTDDEKSALLDGMSSGAVEVQSSEGAGYAEVRDYEIGRRSRIKTNSFPRLQLLNQQFTDRMSRRAEQLLNCETDIVASQPSIGLFSDLREQVRDPSLLVEFEAEPLAGTALIYLESELVSHLVESFFGGGDHEAVRQNQTSFTPGETIVSNLFVNEILSTVKDVWESLTEFNPVRTRTRLGTDLIDGVDSSDLVISTDCEMSFLGHRGVFCIVWPVPMVSTLVPVLEGQKRERDPAEDARWHKALHTVIADIVVNVSTCVGGAKLMLGDLVGVKPGDVIDIDNPRKATVFATKVPVLDGRFGVHDGQNAIETVGWLRGDATTKH
jgi:flagellar motor switch protein FliM